jgi:hypothetical protein
MKTINNPLYFILCTLSLLLVSCEPKGLKQEDVLVMDEVKLMQELKDENPEGMYTIYNINDFLDAFMTEEGNFKSDSSLYRTRSAYNGLELFSIDTVPVIGPGIYLRGRIATDDYGGNFYKSMVIQQTTDRYTGKECDQQNLRISVDMGSASGLFQQGQEILIRCNGLAVGRYANQPQLCVPSYNNNIFAQKADQKTGWAPGRIPSAQFRNVTRLIGTPDKSKLVYDEMSLATLYNTYLSKYQDIVGARIHDGRLVRITNVHFTGTYDNYGEEVACTRYDAEGDPTVGNPELDGNACTFGPTTGNVGYPQSRYVEGGGRTTKRKVLVSTSEYARYAYFYLPASKYTGSITGILGYYMDNGNYDPDGGEWSITPCNLEDILPESQNAEDPAKRWVPTEWKAGVSQPE